MDKTKINDKKHEGTPLGTNPISLAATSMPIMHATNLTLLHEWAYLGVRPLKSVKEVYIPCRLCSRKRRIFMYDPSKTLGKGVFHVDSAPNKKTYLYVRLFKELKEGVYSCRLYSGNKRTLLYAHSKALGKGVFLWTLLQEMAYLCVRTLKSCRKGCIPLDSAPGTAYL